MAWICVGWSVYRVEETNGLSSRPDSDSECECERDQLKHTSQSQSLMVLRPRATRDIRGGIFGGRADESRGWFGTI